MVKGIYKIISPSNKIYVGQSWNIEKRFKKYKNLDIVIGSLKLLISGNKPKKMGQLIQHICVDKIMKLLITGNKKYKIYKFQQIINS